jgi:hypothetical protein
MFCTVRMAVLKGVINGTSNFAKRMAVIFIAA